MGQSGMLASCAAVNTTPTYSILEKKTLHCHFYINKESFLVFKK